MVYLLTLWTTYFWIFSNISLNINKAVACVTILPSILIQPWWGISMVKYANQKHLLVFWKTFIKYVLMYLIHEYYLSQWLAIISSLTSLHNIEKTHVLICN
jgi:hypothetical protein